MTQSKNKELINGLLLLSLGTWIWWYTNDFPELEAGYPGPALFPKIVAIGFMISGGLLFLFRPKEGEAYANVAFSTNGVLTLLIGLGILAIFPLMQAQVGFIMGLGMLCFCFGLLLRVVLWKAALTALATTSFIYFIFVMGLGVSL